MTVRAALHSGSGPAAPALPVHALAVHMAQRLADGQRAFEIRLDPPELGRIDIRMEIARDGQLTAQLAADRPETLDALQRDARSLERALQTAGLELEDGGLDFQLRERGREGGGQASREPAARPGAEAEDEPAPERRLVSLNALDIRV